MTQAGSPDPRNDRICITSSCPRQFVEAFLAPLLPMPLLAQARLLEPFPTHHHGPGHACDLVGERDGSDLDWPAFHETRRARAASVPRCRAYRMTAMAPATSSHRKYRLPCFEMPPSRSLPPVECCLGTSPIHVWTAPWQELSDVFCSIGRVRSRVRPVDAAGVAAGPNALRGSSPNRSHALGSAMTQTGSPDPRNDRICITSSCPRQFVVASRPPVAYAAGSKLGSLNRSPRTIMAQAMRAILLASATAATLIGRRSMMRASQGRLVPCCRA